jgi:hypothetical protein
MYVNSLEEEDNAGLGYMGFLCWVGMGKATAAHAGLTLFLFFLILFLF